jgi:hypothetical protein
MFLSRNDDRGGSTIGAIITVAVAALVLCLISGVLSLSDIKRQIPGLRPTAADFCNTYKSEGDKLHAQWDEQQKANDGWGSAQVLAGAPKDLATFFDKLAENSPSEIYDDVKRQADAYNDLASRHKGSDVLGSALDGLMSGLANAASEQRVDAYAAKNCEPPVGLKGTNPTGIAGLG